MFQVVKRDGEIAEFKMNKITRAIGKAFAANEKHFSDDMLELLGLRVTSDFQKKIRDNQITVEDIQDSVENVLIQTGYSEVAKAYILYRKQREKVRNMKSTIVDYKDIVNSYVKIEDWRVKENSTVTYSVGGLILSNSGAVTANYWLSEIYDDEVAEAHRNADIHIHDLSMLTGYCAGWSLKQLIQEGLGGIEGKITSAPAKHLSVLCNQMVNFLGIMQNEWAGAQAFSSFDTYLAPFVKTDDLSYQQVKKCIESFIYGVNTPSRWGTQAPFSNITLDWTVPDDLAELPAIVGGIEMDFKYKDCKKEMDMINKAFIETMIEGDANGRGFQYPIPTYSITSDFDWSDTENNRLLFEMTSKYGTPYFSNYINSDMEPSDVRSMCCRLRLDLRELRKKTGGYFGSGESTGSVGVVTINMPRLAYRSNTAEEFYRHLDHMMDISARSLHIKRTVITKLLNEGLYPYTKRYLGSFDNHFSTIGLIGMNEVGLNAKWLGQDMTDEKTQAFSKEVLNYMRNRLSDYQEEYGELYNLEATPAESTTYRLAKHDREQWPDIKTAGAEGDTPYYTNSSHLPVEYTEDIFDALDIQDELQTLYTSGTVFHAFLGEKLPDWKAAASLVRKIAENYKLPYYTLSPTYSVCKEHGYIAGEHFICPTCGKSAEVYSRITGYYRPVQNWNDGKSQEYKNRKLYNVSHSQMKPAHKSLVKISQETVEVTPVADDKKLLFTTSTCPNCRIAKQMLEGEEFKIIDAEQHPDLAQKYGIMQAPTLVVVSQGEATKYVNASNIQRYVENRC
ncbi:ribonucleoside triphosphate reductase [Lactonifactor sp. BIOML-A3]|uniref:ribonucleoside triphosphate reductase n=1 Tax=unclassified Lactonifactor TaxID=2636670 RepID=UPI0012B03234|nr:MULTISPECIES: ribonucleoside triphosphate reductase [unclassified Lactonifactor]MSA03800.1 ribonucleoside triphosphate reductase [Lactonifactor sp. BIOML-A5]MSA10626.1 ribonucleoside triphosphate reductase [Lactonifactor sp. BIOML-A4]MSA15119.1 ribonucleoside triphosphate reductase [Lactonifactor sp. BIOML-A3]MSA19563.1 ribonucleoside triphosphate reductase [Lactonifactor sp. BIOML-A2]MSA40186.1 ribonucleoside triphosphate reductase [Lactonifactor sp. BIOML-A1]